MDSAKNIDVVTQFEVAFRSGDLETLDRLSDPDLVDHNPVPGHEPNFSGFRQKVIDLTPIFPDMKEDLQEILCTGDVVATRWVIGGTQALDFIGLPPGGKFSVEGMNFYRLKDGRVTDVWTQFDNVAMMAQLKANRPS